MAAVVWSVLGCGSWYVMCFQRASARLHKMCSGLLWKGAQHPFQRTTTIITPLPRQLVSNRSEPQKHSGAESEQASNLPAVPDQLRTFSTGHSHWSISPDWGLHKRQRVPVALTPATSIYTTDANDQQITILSSLRERELEKLMGRLRSHRCPRTEKHEEWHDHNLNHNLSRGACLRVSVSDSHRMCRRALDAASQGCPEIESPKGQVVFHCMQSWLFGLAFALLGMQLYYFNCCLCRMIMQDLYARMSGACWIVAAIATSSYCTAALVETLRLLGEQAKFRDVYELVVNFFMAVNATGIMTWTVICNVDLSTSGPSSSGSS